MSWICVIQCTPKKSTKGPCTWRRLLALGFACTNVESAKAPIHARPQPAAQPTPHTLDVAALLPPLADRVRERPPAVPHGRSRSGNSRRRVTFGGEARRVARRVVHVARATSPTPAPRRLRVDVVGRGVERRRERRRGAVPPLHRRRRPDVPIDAVLPGGPIEGGGGGGAVNLRAHAEARGRQRVALPLALVNQMRTRAAPRGARWRRAPSRAPPTPPASATTTARRPTPPTRPPSRRTTSRPAAAGSRSPPLLPTACRPAAAATPLRATRRAATAAPTASHRAFAAAGRRRSRRTAATPSASARTAPPAAASASSTPCVVRAAVRLVAPVPQQRAAAQSAAPITGPGGGVRYGSGGAVRVRGGDGVSGGDGATKSRARGLDAESAPRVWPCGWRCRPGVSLLVLGRLVTPLTVRGERRGESGIARRRRRRRHCVGEVDPERREVYDSVKSRAPRDSKFSCDYLFRDGPLWNAQPTLSSWPISSWPF